MLSIRRAFIALVCAALLISAPAVGEVASAPVPGGDGEARIEQLLTAMTLEQKVSQMIMPAIRAWEGEGVKALSAAPDLAAALRRHAYGGVILFGANIQDAEQTLRLIDDLQTNNAQAARDTGAPAIPYLVAADQEGGSVARLSMGTRGTGSMAIGATGENAEANARAIGQVFGEELAALGINVNLGPCIDVITDLTDLGMSTRVYSDDPAVAARLGLAFASGVGESDVITCFKHFPGAGDGSDYPTAIRLTPEQLRSGGLSAFGSAVDAGAEMIMTSATTFPSIDDARPMADGVTTGFYPATVSPGIVTGMLRDQLGFDGVIITDALEMDQFITEPDNQMSLFPGEAHSVEHDLTVAREAVNAGCDLLLIPTDLTGPDAAAYYDDYIAGIVGLVESGAIDPARIDASARRILSLKARHGLLDMTPGADLDARIAAAAQTVGSAAHHAVEWETAGQAVTLLRDNGALPLSGRDGRIVLLGRTVSDANPIAHALDRLMKDGFIDPDARIDDRIGGEVRGDENANVNIVIDRYYDTAQGGSLVWSDALSDAIAQADAVVCLCAVSAGIDRLQDDNPVMQGVSRALDEAHRAGARFVLLSDNLPVDAARFQTADAIVCAYLSAGFGIDPTARTSGSENVGAFNANVPAALCAIFGAADMPGRLPINLPKLERQPDGTWAYGAEILYERGYSAVKPK